MHGIQRSVDEHRAIFARHAVRPPRVEILDRQDLIPRQFVHRGPDRAEAVDVMKRLPVWKPGARNNTGKSTSWPSSRPARAQHLGLRRTTPWARRRERASPRFHPSRAGRAGASTTGAVVRATISSARASASAHSSASPIALKTRRCGGNGCAGSWNSAWIAEMAKPAIVDPLPGANVAAAGGDQQQQRNGLAGATIRLRDDRAPGEPDAPVLLRRGFAKFGQDAGETLMRLGKAGIQTKRDENTAVPRRCRHPPAADCRD